MQEEKARINAVFRPARPDEAPRLVNFYEKAADPNVLPRPEKEFRLAAEKGAFFVIENEEELIAASGIFEIAPDVHTHAEAGGTYVAPKFWGCGLQSTLIEARVAATVVNLAGMILVTAVKPTNAPSLGNVVKGAGFELWRTPIKELLIACTTCEQLASLSGRPCCCDFYTLGAEPSRAAVRRLLGKLPSYRTRPSTHDGVVLDLSFRGLLFENSEHLDDLREFSA